MKTIGLIVLLLLQMSSFLNSPLFAGDKTPIWDQRGHKFISKKQLRQKITGKSALLLAVRLDNPRHVAAILPLLRDLESKGHSPSLLLSMVERDKQNAFAMISQRNKLRGLMGESRGLDHLLNWNNSGKADWAGVKPLFDFAYEKSLPLIASDFSRYEVGQLHQHGLAGLPKDVKTALLPRLEKPLSPQEAAQHKARLARQFCSELPPDTVTQLSQIHRARTALYALMLEKRLKDFPAETPVLITSPDHLTRNATDIPLIQIAFQDAPSDSAADFIWIAEAVEDPTLCPQR